MRQEAPFVPLADARAEVIATRQQLDERLASLTGTVSAGAGQADVTAELDQLDADVDGIVANEADAAMSGELAEVRALVGDYQVAVMEAERVLSAGQTESASIERYRELGDELDSRLVALVDELHVESDALDAEAHRTVESERRTTVLVWIAAILGVGVAAFWIARMILRPVQRTRTVLSAVATGDLTARLTDLPDDEIGDMGRALNSTLDSVRTAMTGVVEHSTSVAAASEELTAVATQLFSAAEETSAQIATVSAAAVEVSANVSSVAGGTTEVGLSISEISRSAQRAVGVASEASQLAQRTDDLASALTESSERIGDVLRVITSIAEQTNLLALNATIESARAGEAGKGFAVVANEVKQLAGETGGATADIAHRVSAIQNDASIMKTAIDQIAEIIGRVAESQGTIASAVEEQAAVTAEIGRSVHEASIGSDQIAENVDGMAHAARDVAVGAGHTKATAAELAQLSNELRELAGSLPGLSPVAIDSVDRRAVPRPHPGRPRHDHRDQQRQRAGGG